MKAECRSSQVRSGQVSLGAGEMEFAGTLRGASGSRARVPIRRLQATEGGGAEREAGGPGRSDDGNWRIVGWFLVIVIVVVVVVVSVSPAQECMNAARRPRAGENRSWAAK